MSTKNSKTKGEKSKDKQKAKPKSKKSGEEKKRKKKRVQSYNVYIKNTLRDINKDLSLNAEATQVVNNLLVDIYKKIVASGQTLLEQNKKKTFQLDDAIAAGKLVFGANEKPADQGLRATKNLYGKTDEWDKWQNRSTGLLVKSG